MNKIVYDKQVPVPKAKLGDRIASLQQIVSPFGKVHTRIALFIPFFSRFATFFVLIIIIIYVNIFNYIYIYNHDIYIYII